MSLKQFLPKKKTVVIFLILLLCLRLVGNNLLGHFVKKGFSLGTGCIVKLDNPSVSFLPLGGSIENVVLYHPSEPLGEGIKIKDLSIKLHLLPLLKKTVHLYDLQISDATIASRDTNTGFVRLLDFLFGDNPENTVEKKRWHSFITGGWKVRLSSVEIKSDPTIKESLLLAAGPYEYSWSSVLFSAVEPNEDPALPFDVRLKGSDFTLRYRDIGQSTFGDVEANGTIGFGRVLIDQGKLLAKESNVNNATIKGEISLKDEGEYALTVNGAFQPEYLKKIASDYAIDASPIEIGVNVSGQIAGDLSSPEISAALNGPIAKHLNIIKRENCYLRAYKTDLFFSENKLSINNLSVDNVLQHGDFNLLFDEKRNVKGSIELHLERNGDFVTRCLADTDSLKDDLGEPNAKESAVFELIGDSVTKVSLSGALVDQEIDAKLESEINLQDVVANSLITGTAEIRGENLTVTFDEKTRSGRLRKRTSEADNVRDETELRTTFTSEQAATIKGQIRYNFSTQKTDIGPIAVKYFPALRLVARAAPFLDDNSLALALRLFTGDSLVNADLKLSKPEAASSWEGFINQSVTDVTIGRVEENEISVFARTSAGTIDIQEAKILSPAGEILGKAKISENGELTGNIKAEALILDQIPAWANLLTHVGGLAELTVEVGGNITSPKYNGEASLKTYIKGEEEKVIPTAFSFEGNENFVDVSASVLESKGTVKVHYPLKSGVGENIRINVLLEEFPVTEHSKETELKELQKNGVISAQFDYDGPVDTPLFGQGEFVVDKLYYAHGKYVLQNEQPLKVTIRNGRLDVDYFAVQVDEKQLTITGFIDEQKGWNLDISGGWNLDTFFPKVNAIEQVSGILGINVKIGGSLTDPQFGGSLSLRDGTVSFTLADNIVGANEVAVDANFQDGNLLIDRIYAETGQGFLGGKGIIRNIAHADKRETSVSFLLDEYILAFSDELGFVVDGQIELSKYPGELTNISGDAFIQRGAYQDKITLQQLLRWLSSPLRRRTTTQTTQSRQPHDVTINLRIKGDREILIDTDFAELELATDLRLKGTLANPNVTGEVRALSGTFGFRSDQFEIIDGRIKFTKDVSWRDPRINITGESIVNSQTGEEHRVLISIRGTAQNPQVKLTSDTGLSEREIVGLISIGTNVGGVPLISAGSSRRRSLMDILNPASNLSFEERVSGLAGFSDIRLDTAFSDTSGEAVPLVSARKPITRELDLTLRTELASRTVSEARVDYPLTPFLNLFSGWLSSSAVDAEKSGALQVGIQFRKTFPGLRLLPPQRARRDQLNELQ